MPNGKVAVITEKGFEDVELLYPKWRLMEAGFEVAVLTPDGEAREGKNGYRVEADDAVGNVNVNDFDALLIPGGAMNPDKLRMNEEAVDFVRRFVNGTDKPVFSICHGPWVLVEADVLRDVTLTTYRSIRKDVENAGATWKDEPVVVDGRFVTSRHPEDLPQFGREIVSLLHARLGTGAEATPTTA